MMTSAEDIYFFTHAAIRDAAYQLHMPSERARLHELALAVLEDTLPAGTLAIVAHELAEHARLAQLGTTRFNDHFGLREVHWLQQAARHAEAQYRNLEAAQFFERVAAHTFSFDDLRADALTDAGVLYWFAGRRAEAERALTQAIRAAGDDRARRIRALIERGVLYRDVQDWPRAEADLREAARIADSGGTPRQRLRAHGNLATVIDRGLPLDDVLALYEPIIKLARELGHKSNEGVSYQQIGTACRNLGRFDEAAQWLQKALPLIQAANDPLNEAVALAALAETLLHREGGDRRADLSQSLELYRRALATNAEIGNLPQQCGSLVGMAACYRGLGLMDEAERYANQAIQLAAEVRDPASLANAWRELGRQHEERGDEAQAERSYSYGVFAIQDEPELDSACELLLSLSRLLARRGAWEDARMHAQNAQDLAEDRQAFAKAAQIAAYIEETTQHKTTPPSARTKILKRG
jgi:tetratricopeptide (TPR) repeat protein